MLDLSAVLDAPAQSQGSIVGSLERSRVKRRALLATQSSVGCLMAAVVELNTKRQVHDEDYDA